MTDIKELSKKIAKEMNWRMDEMTLETFSTRLIAAYLAEQKPVGVVTREGDKFSGYKPLVEWGFNGVKTGTKLFTAPPEPAPQEPDINSMRPKPAPAACAAPSFEEVQWRNIKHVVKTLADWAFGSKDDPRWGTAWIAIVNGLTAKDGPTFNLESLTPKQKE